MPVSRRWSAIPKCLYYESHGETDEKCFYEYDTSLCMRLAWTVQSMWSSPAVDRRSPAPFGIGVQPERAPGSIIANERASMV